VNRYLSKRESALQQQVERIVNIILRDDEHLTTAQIDTRFIGEMEFAGIPCDEQEQAFEIWIKYVAPNGIDVPLKTKEVELIASIFNRIVASNEHPAAQTVQ